MDRRTRNGKKSKAAKDKENYEATTFSDMTSQDVFYITESNDIQRLNGYNKQQYMYGDQYTTSNAYDRSKTNGNYDSEYRSDVLYSYDDYTTSTISYEEKMSKPKERSYPQSKSEEIYPRKMSPRRRRNSSSTREYDYFSPDEREYRKKLKLTRALEDEFYRDIQNYWRRRSHSPRNEANSYKDFDNSEKYTKYLEKPRLREGSSHKHKKKREFEDVNPKKNKNRAHSLRKDNDYKVFAYQDVDPHEIFKGKQNLNGGTLLASEIEVQTHDYPVLAFKDPKAVDKGSDMVYLPVIVVDKKLGMSSDYQNVPTTPTLTAAPTQQRNYQIFTADLHDQRNIFHNYDQVSNQIPLASSNRESIVNKQTQRAQNPEGHPETNSGIRYAASFLGSIFDQPQFSPPSTRELLPDTKGPQETKESFINTFKTNKNPLTNQINVDVVPSSNDIFQKHPFEPNRHNKSDQIRYTQIHDDYPVTRDYIKVNENTLEEQRKSTIPKRSTVVNRVSTNPARQDALNEWKNTQINREASNMVSDKRSIVRRRVPEVKNNNTTGKASSDVQRSLVMESKRGLTVAANNIQQHPELNLKNVPASTRLSTVEEGVPQDRSVRQTSVAATSREPTVARMSRKDSAVFPSAASIRQGPRVSGKTNGGPRRITEANKQSVVQSPEPQRASERKIHSVTKSVSPYNESIVEQEPTDLHRTSVIAQRASKALKESREMSRRRSASLVRQQSKQTITGVAPLTDKRKTVSTESLKEFTKEVFPEMKNKASAVLSGHPTKTKQSIVDMKATASMTSQKSISGTKQGVVEAPQAKEPSISFAPQTIEQEHLKASVKSGMIPTHAFESGKGSTLQEEKITSEPNIHLVPSDKKPKSKKSLKGLASALVNLGRKSRSSLATTKPCIKVMPESPTPRTSAGRAQDDNGSLFVQSIEPTSTLYKKEQQLEQSQNRRSEEDESKKKSKTKLSTVKEKKSKIEFFSKSRSKTNLKQSENDMSPLSKKKSIWGILRRTKSKDSTTCLAYQDEQPRQEHVPMEGPDRDEKEPPNLQEKSCECLAESVKHVRTCAYFFLGTNLYQQVMNILTEF